MKNPNSGQKRNEAMVLTTRNISYTLTLTLMLMLINSPSLAQDLPGEKLSVHVDRSYYLAGDEILFALYCTEVGSGLPSQVSLVANVELINQQGEIIKREKILIKNGCGSGRIFIPRETNSGEHIIRSYTSWMRNFGPGAFHYTPVLIIHPAKKYQPINPETAKQDSMQHNGQQAQLMEAGIQIGGLRKSYTSRDSIAFTLNPLAISGSPQSATISVSIARSESQYPYPFNISPEHSDIPASISLGDEELNFLPDMRGLQLTGRITRPGSGEPVVNRDILLSFIDSVPDIFSVRSDIDGRFLFDLNGSRGRKDMIIQAPGDDQDILISIHPGRSIERIPEQAWVSLNKDDLAMQYHEMLLEKQLSDAYGLFPENPLDNFVPSEEGKKLPFYGKPDHEIIMESYVRLPVMEEVFRELGKRVFLSRDEGKYKVLILDLETNRLIGDHPFYFIDGIPLFDSEKLLDIDPSLIKSISLKSRKYFMGDLIMDGIIDIRSKKGDAALIDFPRSTIREYFQGFQYPLPVPGNCTIQNSRTPLYKTTLFFESHIITGPGNPASFKLIAPDSKGSYTIAIRGFTNEGFPVQQDFSFQVK